MDRIDILGIQRRMAILSNERDLLFEKLKKEIPVNREEHPEVHEAYQKVFDVFIDVIKAEAKSLG